MPREIILNAFEQNCMGHQSFGMWRHPRDRSAQYKTLGYWTDLARTLERGLFDGLFLADVSGVYDVYGGGPSAALRANVQVPTNDPMLVVPPMAMVTEHLCFGITGNLSYESPVALARRMSTLDHLTEGRVGWNIVTGYLRSAAKGVGQADQPQHDVRYDIAEEYMDIVYKLWETSWAPDAVRCDAEVGVFADPTRVEEIHHDGAYLHVDAVHLCEPSPQRTPVLYQAGSSTKGRAFAARHAECVFVVTPDLDLAARVVADLRQRAVDAGREPTDLKIIAGMTVIAAPSDEEAHAKFADYQRYASYEGALAVLSGWSGIDLSQWSLDDRLPNVESNAIQGARDMLAGKVGSRSRIREIAEKAAIGGTSPVVVGGPATVVDEMERWIGRADVDGFNLFRVVAPETFVDVVDLIVPEMQERGIYKRGYRQGTYREKLFGRGPWPTSPHPAAAYRRQEPDSHRPASATAVPRPPARP